jgi:hypothetical protein
MKRRMSARISEQLAERLEVAAKRSGTTKTAIIAAALDKFLEAEERIEDGALLRRLNWMSRQLEHLDRNLRVVSETAALHARYHLAVTPPLAAADQRAACALGVERFEVFAAQVGRRVHLGTPLMRETMERLSTTKPDLFAHDIEQGLSFGPQSTGAEAGVPASTGQHETSESSAAAREDGSNGGFQGERHSRSR